MDRTEEFLNNIEELARQLSHDLLVVRMRLEDLEFRMKKNDQTLWKYLQDITKNTPQKNEEHMILFKNEEKKASQE